MRLLLEVLEDRSVPSVSVGFNSATGTLTIVDTDTTGHTIAVESVGSTTGSGWLVQVDQATPQKFSGVATINASLGADSDTVNFEALNPVPGAVTLTGNLSVTGGSGNDNINIDFPTIKGNVTVLLGNGADNFETSAAAIMGALSVTEGTGATDTIVQRQASLAVGGNSNLSQGSGAGDKIDISSFSWGPAIPS